MTAESRSDCRFRRNEVDFGVGGAAAAEEIAVEGAQAHAAGIGRSPHADAGAAGAFQHTGAGSNDIA